MKAACQVSSWFIQPFGHNTPALQTDRTYRQRSDSIGRTVLQTVAQKELKDYLHLSFTGMTKEKWHHNPLSSTYVSLTWLINWLVLHYGACYSDNDFMFCLVTDYACWCSSLCWPSRKHKHKRSVSTSISTAVCSQRVVITRRPATVDRTARRQFQAIGQPVSPTQASDAMTSQLPGYDAKCVQRSCFHWGSVLLRSDIKGTQLPPANILILLERQLIALQLCRWQFYIMKLCSRLFVLYCRNCPKYDKFR